MRDDHHSVLEGGAETVLAVNDDKSQVTLDSISEQWKKLLNGMTSSNDRTQSRSQSAGLSKENSRTNAEWGDTLLAKEEDHTRVYVINLNGISLDRRGGQFDVICKVIKETQVDIFCGQEHNLDTTQPHIRSILFNTANQYWERNRLVTSTTPITFHTAYKPGGTMALSVGAITGRVIKQVRDKWGRWVSQELQGCAERKLAIISAYQPVLNKSKTPGNITVVAQQKSLLLRGQDETVNPRTAFRRDLSECLKKYQTDKVEVLLVGDFNEVLGSDPDGMVKISGEYNLIDLMSSRHSSTPPATYARGSKRLDYALASPLFAEALMKAGYEAFNSRLVSDHRGYYFDFDTKLLFGSPTQTLASRQHRGLASNNPIHVTQYIRHKHKLLTSCNAFNRMERLMLPGNRHVYAERLDKDMMLASLTAEKALPKFSEPAWSLELARARRVVILLTKQLSAFRTGIDHSTILQDEATMFDPPYQLPTNVQQCSTILRTTKAEITKLVKISFERRDEERNRMIRELTGSDSMLDKERAARL